MKKSFFSFLLILLLLSGSYSLVEAQTVKIMSYNVRNYNLEDRMVGGTYRMNYPKPEAEKAALVKVIIEEKPDILVATEMGPNEFQAELRDRLTKAGIDYPYLTLAKGVDPMRHIALFSRHPFVRSSSWPISFSYRGGREPVLRGLLEAQFNIQGKTFHLYGVHLKSRRAERDDDPLANDYRVGEANALREIILKKTPPETPYLIVGDFNDSPRSSALKRFLQKGARTLTEKLEARDSQGDTWTHCWSIEDSYSRIDYMLASPALMPAVVAGSARIVDSPMVKIASDHRPLVVTLDLSKLPRLTSGPEVTP